VSDILTHHEMKPPLYVNIETVHVRLQVICFVWSPDYTCNPPVFQQQALIYWTAWCTMSDLPGLRIPWTVFIILLIKFRNFKNHTEWHWQFSLLSSHSFACFSQEEIHSCGAHEMRSATALADVKLSLCEYCIFLIVFI
jgi:hypothetical protein